MQIQQAPIPTPAPAPKAAAVSLGAINAVPDDPKLKDACKQFEGQFFALVLQEMQKTVPDDPELGDDAHEQQIFQGMLDDNMAQQMAKRSEGTADLAEQMYRQLVQNGSSTGKLPVSAEAALSGAAMAVSAIKSSAESSENEHE